MLVDLNALEALRARNQLGAVELILNDFQLTVPLIQNAAWSDIREDVLGRSVEFGDEKASRWCLSVKVLEGMMVGDA